jgi:MOSC domain-containing protein YiiM
MKKSATASAARDPIIRDPKTRSNQECRARLAGKQVLEMKVVSVNVATPIAVPVSGGTVLTAIFKSPVAGRVAVRANNISGDSQADLTVHGGPYKAVYCYPEEHYPYWSRKYPDLELAPGMFGENLTTQGLLEESVNIGDRFRIGSAVLQATQPRSPCYKLGIRFQRPDIVKSFWVSGRSGIYFSIIEEGDLAAGDSIEKVGEEPDPISVADVLALFRRKRSDPVLLDRALGAPLFGGWKESLLDRSRK